MFGGLDFSGTTNPGLTVNNLTTAQRIALTATNGTIVYDTDIGELFQYIAGAWSAVSAGSTQPNASTTVAGKVEIATQAEVNAGTDAGGTGAIVTVIPSTFQAGVTARISTQLQAETGTDDTTIITPLKARQADNVVVFTAGENLSS